MRPFLLIALLTLLTSPARAEDPPLQTIAVEITDFGIYRKTDLNQAKAPDTTTGQITNAARAELYQYTDHIPATVGTSFGVAFNVTGVPLGIDVNLTVKITHPKTKNPDTGQITTTETWPLPTKTASKNNNIGWTFTYPWEAAPGDWTFQLSHAGKVLAEKAFVAEAP